MKIKFFLPFILFFGIALVLWQGLKLHPNEIPSPLINKPIPDFILPLLDKKEKVTAKIFQHQVSLLNIWATWCYACALEHEALLQIAKTQSVALVGYDYKDDASSAKTWLNEKGNPYSVVLFDASGATAIDWGVYGTPETFVIDKKGIIRYKLVGPIDADVWASKLAPLIQQLQSEPL